MDKRPLVYVVRELRKKYGDHDYAVVGYFASKAFLQGKIERYTSQGLTTKEYEVDFTGFEVKLKEKNLYATSQEHVRTYNAFDNFEDCQRYAYALNQGILADSKEDLYRAKQYIAVAKKIEDSFIENQK